MGKFKILSAVLIALIVSGQLIRAKSRINIDVDVNKPGAMIQSSMWGILFEDINFAADGGF
jgi:hypothetical protein